MDGFSVCCLAKCLMELIENMPENRSVGGSIPPLGTIPPLRPSLLARYRADRDAFDEAPLDEHEETSVGRAMMVATAIRSARLFP